MGLLAKIRELLRLRQDEGAPALTPEGRRYGTQLENGTIILAPGFREAKLRSTETGAPQERDQPRLVDINSPEFKNAVLDTVRAAIARGTLRLR